jgi:hypothetical protein
MNVFALSPNHKARTTLLVLDARKRFRSGPIQLVRVTRPARTPRWPTNTDEQGH